MAIWTREQDRAFEDALVAYYEEDSKDCWDKIATRVPGKSVEEIKLHYELLVDDLDRIESGIVPLPCYTHHSPNYGGGDDLMSKNRSKSGCRASKADQECRKGVAWTEDEHRLFLLGLEKYGKGDWRSISRNFVVTRNPTQVASHAQKYFIRLNSMNRDRRRSSIHDITNVNNGDTSASQAAIPGSSPAAGNQSLQVRTYGGTTVGQPVVLPLVLAVGAAVNLSPPSHMAYGIRPPVNMGHTRC